MIRQRLSHQLLSIGLIFILAGCNSLTASTATPIPPTATPDEKYQKVDSDELGIVFDGSIKSMITDSDGNVDQIDATVTIFTVGGKTIELSNNKIVLEGKDAFVITKEYGKIKVTFKSTGGVTIWLKPSQIERFKELLK